jgi:hypothetical protein
MKKNGLYVVVLGVTSGDELALRLSSRLFEEGVSCVPACFLKSPAHVLGEFRDISPSAQEGDSELITKGLTQLKLSVGFWALAVVKVGGHNIDSELVEGVEQASAVGPTTVAYEHRCSCWDQLRLVKMRT